MKKQFFISAIAVIIFSIQFSFAQSDDCLSKLSWLSGTWKMQDKESTIVEEWTNSGTSSLKCKSYEVKGTETIMLENATMSCIGGKQVFTYYPILKEVGDNRQPVNFVLVSQDNNTFVFENKAHDFPQRVVYQKVNENECHAWIEGEENGKMNKVDFYYKKTN
ncbi:hypothetical protein BH11BAC1_BH11BAC1_10300 [soil metagenome]